MKKFRNIILLCLLIILCSSCGSSKLKSISYSELNKKLNNNETFFFVVIRDGCQHCENYVPKIEEILEEYNIVGYKLNYSNLSEKEDEEFYNKFGVDSTPTTIFIKDGQETSIMQRLVGNVSNEKIISKLKTYEYIK